MIEWQPIETAPKDGTPILAAAACGVMSESVFWEPDDGWCFDYGFPVSGLTHWMPLPPPPGCVDAISNSEIVEVLRSASRMIEGSGLDERMDDYSTLNRIDSILSRLESE